MIKLGPDERLLVEHRLNQYKLIGPGRIWLWPWQRPLVKLYTGPQGEMMQVNQVRTAENVPVNVSLQLIYQVDPTLFTPELLPKLIGLQAGGWPAILRWRTEHILRQLLAGCAWRDLNQEASQERLERRLTQTLAERVKIIGLNIYAVCLIQTELPAELQQTIIQTERDRLEPRGRALVLKEYLELFGHQAMSHIVQWELLNVLRRNGQPNIILTTNGLLLDRVGAGHEPIFQMELPFMQRQ
jgi:hypothetical protein